MKTIKTLTVNGETYALPTQLPNPNALTFTGAVTGSYDGSAPLTVEVPSGGSGFFTVKFTLEEYLGENDMSTLRGRSDKSVFDVIEAVLQDKPVMTIWSGYDDGTLHQSFGGTAPFDDGLWAEVGPFKWYYAEDEYVWDYTLQ